MKKLLLLIIATSALSCSNYERKIPENFDYGKTENGLYQNDYFNFKVSFNEDWHVQNKEQVNELLELGEDVVVGDNEKLKSAIEASKVTSAYLLTIFKYDSDDFFMFNPSIMVIAEKNPNFSNYVNGEDYLLQVKELLKETALSYSFEKDISKRKLCKTTFHVLETKANNIDMVVTQEYITTIIKGFSLSFVISYSNEEEKNELYKVIDNIEI